MMTQAVVFDDGAGSLGPLTDLRPAALVRTGALTTLERLAVLLEGSAKCKVAALYVPKSMAALTSEQIDLPVNSLPDGDDLLCLSGRCVLLPEGATTLELGQVLVERKSGDVLAARLSRTDAQAFLLNQSLPDEITKIESTSAAVLHRPWDVIRYRDAAVEIDLALLSSSMSRNIPAGVTAINADHVRISERARVVPGAILDAEAGPIVIDDDATVRPGAVIVGPAYIGRGSTVLERALIKAHTAIGPVCKVAGEVGGTIFQGFANKAHDGHLGDSWVGEWVNLGAGTTNSNLLNTYGEVIACIEPGGHRERTDLTYLGTIFGDHVKTAIMTRIMTGAVFSTGAMIAQADPPTTVGRFEWLTDQRRQCYRLSKFLDVARTVMARRGIEASEAYVARLKELHERARAGAEA